MLPTGAIPQMVNPLRMHFAPINPENGLSTRLANCFLRDKLGFVWIGTQDGLNRFDGRRVKIFSGQSPVPMRISGNDILSIEEDSARGMIWVGSSGGLDAIDVFSCEVIKSYKVGTTIGEAEVPSITSLKLSLNALIIGSQNGVFTFNWKQNNLKEIETYPKDNKANQSEFHKLVERIERDITGNIWICQPNIGITLLPANQKGKNVYHSSKLFGDTSFNYQKFSFFSELTANKFGVIYRGSFFILENLLDTIKLTRYVNPTNSLPGNLTGGINTIDGRPLLYSANKFFRLNIHTGEIHFVTGNDISQNDKKLQGIRCGLVDTQKNLWIATDAGIFLGRLPTINLVENLHADKSGKNSLDRIFSIFHHKDNLWIGTQNNLITIDRRTNKWRSLDSGGYFYFIDSFRTNSLIISGTKGTSLFINRTKKRLSSVYKELLPLENEELNSFCTVADSLYFFGTGNAKGVFVWNVNTHQLLTLDRFIDNGKLLSKRVRKIFKDSKNRIWILSDNSISIIDVSKRKLESKRIYLPNSNEVASVFMDIQEVGDTFWIAAYGKGILKLNESGGLVEFISSGRELSNVGLYRLLKLSDNNLLSTSNDGLFHINTKTDRIIKINKEDGLQTNAYEEGAAYSSNNLYIVGGLDGMSIIDESFFSGFDNDARLYIDDAKITMQGFEVRKSLLREHQIELPPYYQEVTFTISMLEYSFPNAKRFEYKLSPKQDDWVALDNKNNISFVGLPPGEYSLFARSISLGRTINVINGIKIMVLPKWYQTTWFYLLCLLTAAAISYALYRYRLVQLQKEFRFKEKIAADLHDDLGSTITGIKMFTELGVATGSPQYYAPVKQGLTDAALAIREMIWVLDNNTNTAAEILKKLEQNSSALLREKGIAFELNYDAALERMPLKTDEKRDLYLLLKEFVNNSVKYAACSRISLNGAVKGNQIQLTISDNGKGFDLTKVNRGNGIFNMETRAKRCNFILTWNTAPGEGTMLVMTRTYRRFAAPL
jgi:ligand-binding sensor domain-containing protein